MAGMFDTHTHLDYLDDPISAQAEMSRAGMVCIGASPEHAQNAIAFAEQAANVWATVGLHPNDAELDSSETRQIIEQLALHPRVVGIGESGLDFYRQTSDAHVQQAAFEWQCDLAQRTGKVLVIHTRDKAGTEDTEQSAHSGIIRTLQDWPDLPVIFHCFSGNMALLEFGLDRSAHTFFGFAGNVTYTKATEIQNAARLVPLKQMLLETDAPFLSPVPKRGKPNRPAYVRHTLEYIATLRGISVTELEEMTDLNSELVYGVCLRDALEGSA